MNVNQKIMAKYMNNSKNYETHFEFFFCFNEAEKIMAKSTNILEFISILQFSQMHLIFEINVSKEIIKMIAKNCKKL